MSDQSKSKRWLECLDSYTAACQRLNQVVKLYEANNLDQDPILRMVFQDSLIQRYCFTVDCAHQTFNQYAQAQGAAHQEFAKQRVRNAAKAGLIEHTQDWIDMLDSRNNTSHNYDATSAEQICDLIIKRYYSLLNQALNRLKQEKP